MTAQKIKNVIENAGIEFIAENGDGPVCDCTNGNGQNSPNRHLTFFL
jgi:hypothetical protein